MQATATLSDPVRRRQQARGLTLPPLLSALALVALVSGCATNDHAGAPTATSGNQWSRHMQDKQAALMRVGAGTGVEVIRTRDNQIHMNVPAELSFDAGRADIKPAMRPVLDELGRRLDADVRVTIVGHTDGREAAATTDPLSLDRAEAVRDYLVSHGVRRGRLLVEGRGAHDPVASNATEAGRAANRRVEIFLSQPAS